MSLPEENDRRNIAPDKTTELVHADDHLVEVIVLRHAVSVLQAKVIIWLAGLGGGEGAQR